MSTGQSRQAYQASTWDQAEHIIAELANGLPVVHGVGDAISRPHVQVIEQGRDYTSRLVVRSWPDGDGYGMPYQELATITVQVRSAM